MKPRGTTDTSQQAALPSALRGECQSCHLMVARREPMYRCVTPRCKRNGLLVCRGCTQRVSVETRSGEAEAARWTNMMKVAGGAAIGGIAGVLLYNRMMHYECNFVLALSAAIAVGVVLFLMSIGVIERDNSDDALEDLWNMPAEHEQTPLPDGRRACQECDRVLALVRAV